MDADIQPLPVALKNQSEEERKNKRGGVVYGNFLLSKVTNNFSTSKGRYD
jgi:hypothetical protein